MLTAINNAVVLKQIVSQIMFFSLKFVGMVFDSSIISSQIITESSIILNKYLPILQLHVAGFQI